MLSTDTKYRLGVLLTDFDLASQVDKRLFIATPADGAAAIATLATLSSTKQTNDDIALRCYGDFAGSGAQGTEVAKKLNGAIAVLKAKAAGDDAAAVAATFTGQVAGMTTDVTIDADNAGVEGNDVLLVFDGIVDIDAAILAWNTANPTNTITLSSGDGSQIPDDEEEIALADGADAITYIADAKTAMGSEPMSASIYECLVLCMTDVNAANEFRTAYNAMIVAVQATT